MELRKFIATTIREYLNEQKEILLALNGNKSNLTSELYNLVRTKQFKTWFGDWENIPNSSSKVIDDRYGYSNYGDKELSVFINLRNPTYKVDVDGECIKSSNDGAILKFDRFGEKENLIVVTKPNQIKLIENYGSWDVAYNNIFS